MGQAKPRSPSEGIAALEWAEIAGLIEVRPDGSWQMTDFARAWFNQHPQVAREMPRGSSGQCPIRAQGKGGQALWWTGRRIARRIGCASLRWRQP